MNRQLLFLSLFFLLLQPFPAPAQQEQSLLNAIRTLEQTIGLSAGSQLSALDRIAALEQKVYGQARTGSLLVRLDDLRRSLLGASGGAPLQVLSRRAAPASPVFEGDPLAWVNAYPPQFVRIDPLDAKSKVSGDYYPSVLKATKGKTFRFKTMPIPVFVSPFPDRDFTSSVIAGFESWEDRTNGLVRFVQVGNADEARIRVTWKHLGAGPDETGCTLGAHTITKWKSKAPGSVSVLSVGVVPVPLYIPRLGPKYSVPPQVIEVNLDLIESKSPEIRYQVLQNVVTHELGHALGILGHSPYKEDMMYPITDEHSRLSTRDINTITKIYSEKADVPL